VAPLHVALNVIPVCNHRKIHNLQQTGPPVQHLEDSQWKNDVRSRLRKVYLEYSQSIFPTTKCVRTRDFKRHET
jgi:hypothetical protein